MKKLTALVLTLALGMSVSPLVSAQDYDPSELYQQFLQQLQNPNRETSTPPAETSTPDEQPPVEEVSAPPTAPVFVPNAGPLTHEREVSLTGVLIEGNSFHLLVDAVSANALQGGRYFSEYIPGDNTSWYKKDLLVYSHNEDMVKKIIRAAKNYNRPTVRLTGWGSFIPSKEDPNLRLLASITLDPDLTNKANLENLSNPLDPEFNEVYKPVSPLYSYDYKDYYGTISLTAGRAYMDYTDRFGNPLLDENGLQQRSIMYNEESNARKWFEPYNIWNVDSKDEAHRYLVRAWAERGLRLDIDYLRYDKLDVVDILNVTQVDQPIREAAPIIEAPQITPEIEVQVPIKWAISYRLNDVLENECFHPEEALDVDLEYDLNSYRLSLSAGFGTSLELSGSIINGFMQSSKARGTFVGFDTEYTYTPSLGLSVGSDFSLPGGCPSLYSTSNNLDTDRDFSPSFAIQYSF